MIGLVRPNTITAQLVALFEAAGVEYGMSVGFARDLAAQHGFNRTSAELAFYRWRAVRVAI